MIRSTILCLLLISASSSPFRGSVVSPRGFTRDINPRIESKNISVCLYFSAFVYVFFCVCLSFSSVCVGFSCIYLCFILCLSMFLVRLSFCDSASVNPLMLPCTSLYVCLNLSTFRYFHPYLLMSAPVYNSTVGWALQGSRS